MAVHDAQYEPGRRLAIDWDIWRRAEDAADRILGSRMPPLRVCWLQEDLIKQRAAQPSEEPVGDRPEENPDGERRSRSRQMPTPYTSGRPPWSS